MNHGGIFGSKGLFGFGDDGVVGGPANCVQKLSAGPGDGGWAKIGNVWGFRLHSGCIMVRLAAQYLLGNPNTTWKQIRDYHRANGGAAYNSGSEWSDAKWDGKNGGIPLGSFILMPPEAVAKAQELGIIPQDVFEIPPEEEPPVTFACPPGTHELIPGVCTPDTPQVMPPPTNPCEAQCGFLPAAYQGYCKAACNGPPPAADCDFCAIIPDLALKAVCLSNCTKKVPPQVNCPAGFTRQTNNTCKRNPCPPGLVWNSAGTQCVKPAGFGPPPTTAKCPAGKSGAPNGKCVPTVCPTGTVRNKSTFECDAVQAKVQATKKDEFPWMLLAIGGVVVLGAGAIIYKSKKKKAAQLTAGKTPKQLTANRRRRARRHSR